MYSSSVSGEERAPAASAQVETLVNASVAAKFMRESMARARTNLGPAPSVDVGRLEEYLPHGHQRYACRIDRESRPPEFFDRPHHVTRRPRVARVPVSRVQEPRDRSM